MKPRRQTRWIRAGILLTAGAAAVAGSLWLRAGVGPAATPAAASATVQVQLANQSAAQGDYGIAVEQCRAALKADPAAEGAHRVLGYALYRVKRFGEAREALETAVRKNPTDAFAACFLGLTMAENPAHPDDVGRAAILLESARHGYRGAEPYYGLGLLALGQRRHAEAIEHFRKAVELDPGWETGRYRLAEAFRLAGRPAAADREGRVFETLKKSRPEYDRLVRAVARNPGDVAARMEFARLCLRTRRYREALDQLRPMAQRAPGPDVFRGIATAADALGEKELADRARTALQAEGR